MHRWLLPFLLLATACAGSPAPPAAVAPRVVGGFDAYRFGMSRSEVTAVRACEPYLADKSGGDLECPNFELDGARRTISFRFDASGRLTTVKIWFAEATDVEDGVRAYNELDAYLVAHLGATPARPGLLVRILLPGQKIVTRATGTMPPGTAVWSEAANGRKSGYDVTLLYGDPSVEPERYGETVTSR